ncbi:hypothetical protein F5884DRAFT_850119 [Xylogone sp. PMI_703]|nr:hypothetical protein F5884DRAFT_850119 [Xylogone sp. PMI_703]
MMDREREWSRLTPALHQQTVLFGDAMQSLNAAAPAHTSPIRALNMRMTRELLARVMFLYNGSLTRSPVAALLSQGIRLEIKESRSIGMVWRLDRSAVRWMLQFVREGLHLEYLIDAAAGGTGGGRGANSTLHMIKLRLMYVCESVFMNMVIEGIGENGHFRGGNTRGGGSSVVPDLQVLLVLGGLPCSVGRLPIRGDLAYHTAARRHPNAPAEGHDNLPVE